MKLKNFLFYWINLIIIYSVFQYGLFRLHRLPYLNLIDEILVITLFMSELVLFSIGRISIKRTVFDIPVIILITFVTLSSAINQVPANIFLLGMKGYFIYLMFFYSVIWAGLSDAEVKKTVTIVLAIFMIQFLIVASQFTYFSLRHEITPDSISGTFSGANFLGYSVFVVLYYVFYNFYFNSKKKYFVYVALFTLILILSSARFAILIFPFIFIILNFRDLLGKKVVSRLLTLIGASLFVLMMIFLINPHFVGGGKSIFSFLNPSTLVDYFTNYESQVESGSARNLWYPLTKDNLANYSVSPLLGFGVGMYGSFAAFYYMPKTNLLVYDHFNQTSLGMDANIDSQIIPIWGETGYIGLFLFYLLFIIIFLRMRHIFHMTKNKYLQALSGTMMAYTLFFMIGFYINHLLESQTTGMLFFLFLALTEQMYYKTGPFPIKHRMTKGESN